MSYYDRLQGAMSGMESAGAGHLNQLNETKEKASDAFSSFQGGIQSVASNALKGDLKIAGRHIGLKEGKDFAMKHVIEPRRAKMAVKQTELDGRNATEKGNIETTGQGRVDATTGTTEDAYKMGDGSIIGASKRPDGSGHDFLTEDRGTAVEGKVVNKGTENGTDSDLMDSTTGLKTEETSRLADMAGEEVGGAFSKISKGLDFLGPAGEVASLGMMLFEGIKTAHEAHHDAKVDNAGEGSAIQTGAQASMYAGMNRPSFGSMALPSFDTSKSSAMLQQ